MTELTADTRSLVIERNRCWRADDPVLDDRMLVRHTLAEERDRAHILERPRVDAGRHEARIDGRPILLSALELRLVATLLDADGRALTRDQLLDGIHGTGEGDVLDRAIDVYVKRLREKLGDDANAPRYVATVRGVGYRAAGRVERRRLEAAAR